MDMAAFEWDNRKLWQNPEEILETVIIRPDFIAADIGCGNGFFTIPLAFKVKYVYGIDVNPEKLEQLKNKLQEYPLKNVKPLLARENKIPLVNELIDLLISINTLHEFVKKDPMVIEMHRVLKSGGIALISDFRKKDTGFGPTISRRLSMGETMTLFGRYGFQTLQTHMFQHHYLLVFSKKI